VIVRGSISLFGLIILLAGTGLWAFVADTLEQSFREPPESANAWTWWMPRRPAGFPASLCTLFRLCIVASRLEAILYKVFILDVKYSRIFWRLKPFPRDRLSFSVADKHPLLHVCI